jgi:asparagine synthase (glutamine-hydrolysing)
MESHDRRWVIAFNGEIYNFAELRSDLEQRGERFRGHSDTEVLLAAVSRWGVEGALERSNGMFALALWDQIDRRLWLARDRMGEKPLYYGFCGDTFVFASELKAFRRHPAFDRALDRDALDLFFRYGYIPAPHSIYSGVHKLLPGSFLTFRPGGQPVVRAYWSLREAAERGVMDPLAPKGALEEVETLLSDAVKLRMTSDVPLGAFLSGGVDSSLIVALMQAQDSRPVRTFTIGFPDASYDESPYASEVAACLGTDHTELSVTHRESLEVIPQLPEFYDEPFADSSQIPTYLVSRIARSHVTVALSGDGGDELFLGYDRYRWAQRISRVRHLTPEPVRRVFGDVVGRRSPEEWDRLAGRVFRLVRRPGARVGDRLHRLPPLLGAGDSLDVYVALMTHWSETPVLGAQPVPARLTDPGERAHLALPVDQFAYLDGISYLPDDILVKVDRASMAVSLEARVPLLDHRVVELAWRIPAGTKIRDGQAKWPLRQLLRRHLPERLIDRPKMGFGVPIGAWLREPLRPWVESLLDERRLCDEGYLAPGPVREIWRRHLDGRSSASSQLWDVLMFQAWVDHASAA